MYKYVYNFVYSSIFELLHVYYSILFHNIAVKPQPTMPL